MNGGNNRTTPLNSFDPSAGVVLKLITTVNPARLQVFDRAGNAVVNNRNQAVYFDDPNNGMTPAQRNAVQNVTVLTVRDGGEALDFRANQSYANSPLGQAILRARGQYSNLQQLNIIE